VTHIFRHHRPLAAAIASALALCSVTANAANNDATRDRAALQWAKHIVVIYQENHSFDNLYGNWEPVNGAPVNGLANADPAHTLQASAAGPLYDCLMQNDPNLTVPPLSATCNDATVSPAFASHFANVPFAIDGYIPQESLTRDLVHRYYQEQYQIHHGQQDRYVTGSDAIGLSMGNYDTTQLPVYAYLHGAGAPNYVVLDAFFQSAFGGSFLNHQWFVAARSPQFAGALNDVSSNDLHSVVDANGMPTSYPLYTSPLGSSAKDMPLTASCNPPAGRPVTPAGVTCGDYAVNTIQPWYQPYSPGTLDAKRLPPVSHATIGDRLSEAGVDWAWYSGGWSNADGDIGAPGWTNGTEPLAANASSTAPCPDAQAIAKAVWPVCPDILFQFHHQALNYFSQFAPGTPARAAHLRDEAEFIQAAQAGQLKPVSFIKPIGEENEHPGYASVAEGSQHLVELLQAIFDGPDGDNTLVLVTYDEFGGTWDHVPPPGQGDQPGPHDIWGPGTRIPALLVSRHFERSTVDHTQYDTTSALATIERRFGLAPLSSRDAAVANFAPAVRAARD
jgi:acid phosphatase